MKFLRNATVGVALLFLLAIVFFNSGGPAIGPDPVGEQAAKLAQLVATLTPDISVIPDQDNPILPTITPQGGVDVGVQEIAPQRLPVRVVSVIDGDTIDVLINRKTYRVRYILMDTPEEGEPFYAEATEANRALVEGQTVFLQKDVSETDRYGRLLRYVYLEDGTLVNSDLVRQGMARVATFPPDLTLEDDIRSAQAVAAAEELGIWGASVPWYGPTVTANANLRAGPGTDYPIADGLSAGDPLTVVAISPGGDWYQLKSGQWIAQFLVAGAPGALPVVTVAASDVGVGGPLTTEMPLPEEAPTDSIQSASGE